MRNNIPPESVSLEILKIGKSGECWWDTGNAEPWAIDDDASPNGLQVHSHFANLARAGVAYKLSGDTAHEIAISAWRDCAHMLWNAGLDGGHINENTEDE